jgi:hypothetical protein
MRRFSIVGMMGFVVLCALGLAALRNANELWAGAWFLLVCALLGISILGCVYQEGPDRAWWLGFLLFCGGYTTLAFGPWFSDQVGPSLLTVQVVRALDSTVTGTAAPRTATADVLKLQADYDRYKTVLARTQQAVRSPNDPALRSVQAQLSKYASALQAAGQPLPNLNPSNPGPRTRLRALLPGAANSRSFLGIVHCLSALLAGSLGALVASRFASRRESEPATES